MRFPSLLRVFSDLACASAGIAVVDSPVQIPIGDFEPVTPSAQPSTRPPSGQLRCLQVVQPVLGPEGPILPGMPSEHDSTKDASCSVLLMEHTFGFSYGKPFVATYTPPQCDFDRVVLNLTVTSAGRQFDRLAAMFLNDTEVWRTSTAEPRPAPGIVWTYIKDMTQYLSLWRSSQKLIFDLGNLIDDKYTGTFNCTLTATFFRSQQNGSEGSPPSDLIIPISARRGSSGQGSAWSVPQQKAADVTDFPRNAQRAVFSISANGQLGEEFWWSNLLQSDAGVFNGTVGRMPGLSPFREVQLLIDGQLAGVQWPFPVVFTGGVSPGLHRPIVGLQAFDLREHEIDITPWLPLLCDGEQHTFEIQVKGIYDNGKTAELTDRIGHYWVITGKIFVWLGEEGSVTTGRPPVVEPSNPIFLMTSRTSQNSSGVNEALEYSLRVHRTVSIHGEVVSGGQKQRCSWKQELAYSNLGEATSFGTCQINDMNITGVDRARGLRLYKAAYSYPLWANQTFSLSPSNNLSIEAQLNQSLDLEIHGAATFPTGLEAFQFSHAFGAGHMGSRVSTLRTGHAVFSQTGDKKRSTGHGSTQQIFSFSGVDSGDTPSAEQLYFRNVSAVNDTIVSDHEIVGHELHRVQLNTAPGVDEESESLGQFAPVKGKTRMAYEMEHSDQDNSGS